MCLKIWTIRWRSSKGRGPMEVFVRDNDVNAALRVWKKKMQREGTFRELKRPGPKRSHRSAGCAKRRKQGGATVKRGANGSNAGAIEMRPWIAAPPSTASRGY